MPDPGGIGVVDVVDPLSRGDRHNSGKIAVAAILIAVRIGEQQRPTAGGEVAPGNGQLMLLSAGIELGDIPPITGFDELLLLTVTVIDLIIVPALLAADKV